MKERHTELATPHLIGRATDKQIAKEVADDDQIGLPILKPAYDVGIKGSEQFEKTHLFRLRKEHGSIWFMPNR